MLKKKKRIIKESVENNQVIDAIKKRYEVKVTYQSDEDPKGSGERLIQPVAYGLSKSGNPVIRAFQPFGDTKTKVPHWKMFRLDRLVDWKPLKNRKFQEPPQFPYTTNGKFNPTGDKSMSVVYVISDFKGSEERYEKGGLKKYNYDRRMSKIASDPFYQMRKNIENSTMATPDVMKRVKEWQKNKPKETERYLKGENFKEMEKANNFNDKVEMTNGPLTKGEQETNSENSGISPKTFDKIKKNGPIFKNKQ